MRTDSIPVETLTVGRRVVSACCPVITHFAAANDGWARIERIDHSSSTHVRIWYEGLTDVSYPRGETLSVVVAEDPPAPSITVLNARGVTESWKIFPAVSDYEGNLHTDASLRASQPIDLLKDDPALLNHLRFYQVDFNSTIARKDSIWGIVYEVEFWTQESWASFVEGAPASIAYPPRANVVASQVARIAELEAIPRNKGIAFAIPPEDETACGKVAIWAFCPIHELTGNRQRLEQLLADMRH